MPPSRSATDSSRFDPLSSSDSSSHSRPRPVQPETTQPVEVIVISSDDEEEPKPKPKSPIHSQRMSKRRLRQLFPELTQIATEQRTTRVTHQDSVTVARILAGDFGDPQKWSFGLPEHNFMDVEKLLDLSRNDPLAQPFMASMSEAQWRHMQESLLRTTDPKVYGVRYLTYVLIALF